MIRPKLGFLGVGWIGQHRMKAIAQSELAEVKAICDISSDTLQEAAKAFPEACRVGSFGEMLRQDLDGIVIATPSAMHAGQSIQALNHGFAVFCQKPLGRTVSEVSDVIGAARTAGRLLGVDLSYRYTRAMQQVRKTVLEGKIGQVFSIDLIFHNAYGPDKPWFYQPELSGGGCVMDLGVHLIDLALWTLGSPKVVGVTSRLFAKGKLLKPPQETVEDYAIACIEFENGTVAQLACSWHLSLGCDAMIAAAFYGTEGGIELRNVGGSFYDFTATRFHGTSLENLVLPPDEWGGRAAVDWAQQLSSDSRFDRRIENLIDVAQVIDSIYGR